MLLFSVIVAGSFSFGKLIAGQIDPIALTAARFTFAALILGAALAVSGRFQQTHFRSPWRFLILGGAYALFFVMMFEALKTATPVSTAAVFTLMPLFAAIMDLAISGRRTSLLVWMALAIGGLGAVWVVFRGSVSDMLALRIGKGEALFLIGTASHAAYAALVPKLRRGEPAYATTLGVAVAGAVLLAALFFSRIQATDWRALALLVWAVLMYLAIFASIGTFTLVNVAAMKLSSAKVTAYTYLIPFWVLVIEMILGQSAPKAIVLLGGLPIFLALALLFIEKERANPQHSASRARPAGVQNPKQTNPEQEVQ